MVADFFTKPLQGSAFVRFRNFLLNVDSSIDATENLRSVLGNDDTGRGETGTTSVTTISTNDVENKDTERGDNDVQNPQILVGRKQVKRDTTEY